MSEWKEYLFEEIIQSMQLGTSAIGNEKNFGVPLLKMGNLLIGGFNFEKLEKLKENDTKKLASFLLQKGDFLFNTRNTLELVGKSAVWNNQLPSATFNSNIMRIKFKEKVDDFYLGYYFSGETGWNEFKRVATGTTSVAAIYSRDLVKCKVYLPEYKIQLKIAHILTTCDAVIEKTQAAIAKYKAIKQGMLHDLFTRGIVTEPTTYKDKTGMVVELSRNQLRPKYEDAPELYKESKLGMVPREWKLYLLEDVTEYVDYRGKTPPKSDFGIYLVTARNIKEGYIDYEVSKEYIREDAFESAMSRGKVKFGDVLITTEAPMGNVAQIDKENIALAQRVIKYRGHENKLNNDFLARFLMCEIFKRQLNAEATGSTVLGIKGSRLHKLSVFVPEIKEQQLIISKLKAIDNKLQSEQNYLQKLQSIKQGLMGDLLSGKVRTVDLAD